MPVLSVNIGKDVNKKSSGIYGETHSVTNGADLIAAVPIMVVNHTDRKVRASESQVNGGAFLSNIKIVTKCNMINDIVETKDSHLEEVISMSNDNYDFNPDAGCFLNCGLSIGCFTNPTICNFKSNIDELKDSQLDEVTSISNTSNVFNSGTGCFLNVGLSIGCFINPIINFQAHGSTLTGASSSETDTNVPHNNSDIFSHSDVALSFINSSLFWNLYKVIHSRGDGHCILYSIISSLWSQHGITVSKSSLMEQVMNECINNKYKYCHIFNTEESPDMFDAQVYGYIYEKTYGTLFVDILLEILATILDMYVIVLYKEDHQIMYHKLPHDETPQRLNKCTPKRKAVLLLKTNQHYEGLEYVAKPV